MTTNASRKTTAIRKAASPLVLELNKRIKAELAKRHEETVMAKAESAVITFEMVEKLTDTIQKMANNAPTAAAVSPYEPHDQAKGSGFQYSGFVRSDGAYYIQRVSKGEQRYAKGTGNYTDSWGRRDKLDYGYIDGGK